jgi:hypothetical protein
MQTTEPHDDAQEREAIQRSPAAHESVPPWSEIEPGRFMPRRIRGSYRGGKLG